MIDSNKKLLNDISQWRIRLCNRGTVKLMTRSPSYKMKEINKPEQLYFEIWVQTQATVDPAIGKHFKIPLL